jgi:hypothetical protein
MGLRVLKQLHLPEKSSCRSGRSTLFSGIFSLSKPQEGLQVERENVSGGDNVCLGNIAVKSSQI